MVSGPNEHYRVDRRTFLVAGGLSFGGLALPKLLDSAERQPRAKARSTILIWLSGGPSHVDLWDMKPDAPLEYRGEFDPIATSSPEIALCEHLPHLSQQAHHLAIVRSVGQRDTPNDHHAGYFYNLTGHPPEPGFDNRRRPKPDDWPFVGSVVNAKLTTHPYLPSLITLPDQAGAPGGRRPGQYAGLLGNQYNPLVVYGSHENPLAFRTPELTLQDDVTFRRLRDRQDLLRTLERQQRELQTDSKARQYDQSHSKALALLTSAKVRTAFDLQREPVANRERYGPGLNAMSMIMARRLVEVGVPFVTLYWKHDYEQDKRFGCLGGAWDTHWKNFSCLKDHLVPKFDRPFATLLDDLHQRGLLDETLVAVTSEMGRHPKIGDRRSGGVSGSGRDHWTPCMSVLLAGGGVCGGQTYGKTDNIGAYPAEQIVGPADIAKTIYYAMGIDDLHAVDRLGRPIHLMEAGAPITALF